MSRNQPIKQPENSKILSVHNNLVKTGGEAHRKSIQRIKEYITESSSLHPYYNLIMPSLIKYINGQCDALMRAIITGNTGKVINILSRIKIKPRFQSERDFAKILDDNHIKYQEQVELTGCVYIRQLSYDFYVITSRRRFLVELDGIYHSHIVRGNLLRYILQKERDAVKDRYCEENKIYLLRISMKNFGRLSECLDSYLQIRNPPIVCRM
jgi:hypothetical protein